jgi:hypothetical protein
LRLPFIRATSLGHEVLHNWWGNGVYVDYAKGNWSEGLTTFMADYAGKERESAEAAREMRQRWLRDFAAVPAGEHASLASFRSRTHGAEAAVGYGKAAMVFLMLRDEIGSPAFQAGIQRFWREQQFRVAAWSDLRAAFEAAAQRPLDVFFRQWLERAGAPQLTLRGVERAKDGTVNFTLIQSEPPYQLAVPVVIETVAGAERHVVHLNTAKSHYALRPAARATALRIDPDYRLFRRLPLEEVAPIIRSLIVAPNAVVAIADTEPDITYAGRDIAARLLEAGWRPSDVDKAMEAKAPLLLVGTALRVADALTRAGLPPPPDQLTDRGTARVWTARYRGDIPLLVVEGQDVEALRQTAAAIRHYGASSYLVFEGSKVIDRGVWPPTAQPLQIEWIN